MDLRHLRSEMQLGKRGRRSKKKPYLVLEKRLSSGAKATSASARAGEEERIINKVGYVGDKGGRGRNGGHGMAWRSGLACRGIPKGADALPLDLRLTPFDGRFSTALNRGKEGRNFCHLDLQT